MIAVFAHQHLGVNSNVIMQKRDIFVMQRNNKTIDNMHIIQILYSGK